EPMQADDADASKVEDTLRYLNAHGNLNKELEVDSLVAPLLDLGTDQALEILSHLEQKNSE
ncbi:unnamed protein product, partial [Symbiodinium natans]